MKKYTFRPVALVLAAFLAISALTFTVLADEAGDMQANLTYESVNGMISDASVGIVPGSGFPDGSVTYTFSWSDGSGELEGYTPLKTYKAKTNEPFTVELGNALNIPDGASCILVTATAKSKEIARATVFLTEKSAEKGDLLLRFGVVSDIHIRSSAATDLHTKHFKDAMNDIYREAPDTSVIVSVGDNVDAGKKQLWEAFISMRDEFLAGKNIEWLCGIGNHEVSYGGLTFDEYTALFREYTGSSSTYYSFESNGFLFLVLGTEKGSESCWASLSDTQLDWLKTNLENAPEGKPVFVFLHQPLKDTTSGTLSYVDPSIQDWYGVQQNDRLLEILNGFPEVIMFCGHTHWHYDCLMPCLSGCGKSPTFFNTASVGYLWNDQDAEVKGSQGLFVEVYEGCTLVRGYDFEKDKWIGSAQFRVLTSLQAKGTPGETSAPENTSEPEEKQSGKGCESAVLPGIYMTAAIFLAAFVILIRKEEKHA